MRCQSQLSGCNSRAMNSVHSEMDIKELTNKVKADALSVGFSRVGICMAGQVDISEADAIGKWLQDGCNSGMAWMARNGELRFDPRKMVPGCKSIVSVAWRLPVANTDPDGIHVARFARTVDYHRRIKDMLYLLLQKINEYSTAHGRAFTDSAPLLERYWAQKAGLGWIGLNHCLTVPGCGSWYMLGELLIDIELEPDRPVTEKCNACGACVSACPTGALHFENGKTVVDARLCLSYHTIESKEQIPDNIATAIRKTQCIFGCDECQKACPENALKPFRLVEELTAIGKLSPQQWNGIDRQEYDRLAPGTPVERTGFDKLRNTIDCLQPTNGKAD